MMSVPFRDVTLPEKWPSILQHRFEADFARKIHDVAHETEPVVFINVGPIAIDECRLAAFVSARNCLSSHCAPFLFVSLRVD
jgi:hypothetical protein